MAYYEGLPPDDQDELLQIARLKWERQNKTNYGKKAE
jgi:hypothetical protein